MRRFHCVALAAVAGFGFASVASAADLPTKAPNYKVPVYSWTGFYVGGNVGYGVARDPSGSTFSSTPPFPETFNLAPHGALGGGQVGYNWQTAPNWVLGIEADIQASAQTDSTTCVTTCISVAYTQVSQKLPWFGTLRGRLGWTNGPALYYLTGGLAYGQVTTDVAVNFVDGVDSRSFSHNKSGWTIGGGIEAQVVGNWTAKVEYLYVDLGSVTDSFAYTPDPTASTSYAELSVIRNHVARLGLNYKLGDPVYAPAARSGGIYKAPPAAFNWSGFYLGGNVGYGVARDPSESTNLTPIPAYLETFNLSPHGVLGGGQVGYNWQAAPNLVVGIEADLQASAQTDSTTCVATCTAISIGGIGFTQVSQKLPWFGTLRGRLGWTNGPALYYLTGGWAYGQETKDVAVNFLSPSVDSRNFSHRKSGWTIGGGIEAQVVGNWTAKVEYLYVDLGSVTDTFVTAVTSYVESSAIRNHVARIGLNYKLGGPVY